jgi:hypothetical protein
MATTDEEPPVLPEPKSVTIVCAECNEIIRVNDIHAYLLANHLNVCHEMTLLNGERD